MAIKEKPLLNAKSVAETLSISQASAYRIIAKLNLELEQKGYCVIRGKLSRKYFEERFGFLA